ncbi:MAG: hypothetical protein QNJ73_04490 [Gammaproteobacteria bacterium]|nr:hypothetical protein [Gammaproteobacteria bacterium]
MNLDAYTLLVFLHVLLFAYWLGPDWGVFVSARRVANDELTRDERLRFLTASVEIDVLPRSAIVLIIAVGFTLSYLGGFAKISEGFIWTWWALSAGWLLLVWFTGYILVRGPLRDRLDRLHLWLRHAVTAFLSGLGLYSIVTGGPVSDRWLATKLILVGVLLVGGSVLRVIVASWVRELTAPAETVPGSAGAIAKTYPMTRRLVYVFWGTTIAIAFLGVAKPF